MIASSSINLKSLGWSLPACPFGVSVPISMNPNSAPSFMHYNQRFRDIDEIKNILSKLKVPIKEIMFVEHHLAHAATAYYPSPWNLTTVGTLGYVYTRS